MLPVFQIPCSMKEDAAFRLVKLIRRDHGLRKIKVSISRDRETHNPQLTTKIPLGEVLVTFKIPRTTDMPHFWGEFNKTLNPESTVPTEQKG